MSMAVGTNEARMVRQQTYISSLMDLIHQKIGGDGGDYEFTGKLFDSLGSYLVTSFSRTFMINEAWKVRNYTREPVLELAGEHAIGSDGFMEFHVDQNSLLEAVLKLYYQEVQ
jgi:hypothetical protein